VNKTKIMVVEDESIVARDIRNMLLGLGYEVTDVLTTAREAVSSAENKTPDLVLMDIMLHGESSGVEAADEIYGRLNIPVVYLTAFADENTLQRAKKTEPFGYLLKPFEERELQTAIEIARYKFEMEMKLKNRERWLSTILESVADAVIATDYEGLVTFMNPMAESLTGWSQKQAASLPLGKILQTTNSKTGNDYQIPIDKVVRDSRWPHATEVVLRSKNGGTTPIDHKIVPIRNQQGAITGTVITFTDISRRKKAEDELIQSFQKQHRTMEGAVQAMAFTIETRDPYTAGHQRRVTRLSQAIATEMGLTDEQIEGISMAGTLHDIGKIYVPAEILSKPGKISEVEFNIIKTHPKVGYDILKQIEFPWPIADIVLQHHERMDGSGYPSGLSGEQILMPARILAVADVIEAMATHRPYRPALTIEAALDEITRNRGRLYDPEVVDACLRVFQIKGFSLNDTSDE